MAELRDGFADIVRGWTTRDDYDDVTDRIERLAVWVKANGGSWNLSGDERATVKMLVEVQFIRAEREGVLFDPVHIPGAS